ncbi:hypothetical protein K3495_g3626 [Podosphaera aphanis]|nr:hypothetical protein K3495_g3626 [Podosphaera aphanis]
MSQGSKPEEVAAESVAPTNAPTTTETSAPAITEGITIPVLEPTVATTIAPEAEANAAATDAVVAAQEVVVEQTKAEDKPEESPRSGLLKGFQQRLAGVFPKKTEKNSEGKEEKKEDKKSETSDEKKDDAEEKAVKQRSASRKRNSLLGGFGIGKKDEKPAVEETPVSEPTSNPEPTTVNEASGDKGIEAGTASAPDTPTERPGLSKRASIFDTFKSHFVKKDKAEHVTATKESEAVSESAPVIPAVGSSEPAAPEATVVENAQEVPEAKTEKEKPTSKFEKRKSSLPFGLGLNKKEKVQSGDDEAVEKPLSPFAKLRATVKSKASPKFSSEKKEDAPALTEAKNEGESGKPSDSSEAEPITTATPAVAASA